MWSWKISRVDWKIESIIIFSSPLSFVSVDNQCERPKLRKTSRIERLAVHWQYYDCRKSKIQSFYLNGNQQFGRLLIADCSGHCSQKFKRTKAGWKAWRDCRNLGLNLFVSADLRAAVTLHKLNMRTNDVVFIIKFVIAHLHSNFSASQCLW